MTTWGTEMSKKADEPKPDSAMVARMETLMKDLTDCQAKLVAEPAPDSTP